MVLDVHGGPWARNEYGYGSWPQWLSNRGFAVLNVNYRGSTGFGKAFVNAGDKQWAADMHNDLIDAVDWAIAEGIAPADKIAIAGGSYGGYATLVGVTYTPEKFACGVDIVGPSNLVTLLESIPAYWASFLETFAQRVGDPRTEEGRSFLRSRSPLYLADEIVKPLLIGQGANDPRVKQPESDQIVSAMQARELPVTYVLYPDEGHGFGRPENRESFYSIMEVFLADCLGGRSQTFGDAFEGSSTQVPVGAEHITGLQEALDGFEPVIKN
jgi:dipeptidyl aminopeptidase/acylaminoacyl peptidase